MFFSIICLSIIIALIGHSWITQLFMHNKSYIDEKRLTPYASISLLAAAISCCFLLAYIRCTTIAEVFHFLIPSIFLLFTCVSDIMGNVIFTRMMIPFAILAIPFMFTGALPLWDYLLAAALGGASFFIFAALSRGGIGGGDVRLVAVLGLWLASSRLLYACISGILLGGVAALILLLVTRSRHTAFPYGPFIAIPAIIALLP